MGVAGMVAGMVAGVIAMLQGAAWLGPRRARPRSVAGACLTSTGLVLFLLALLTALVPGFWG